MVHPRSDPNTTEARLRADVHALARPEGRRVGTTGHAAAVAWLNKRLEASGLDPYGETYALPYEVARARFVNLAAVAPGRDRGVTPIVLGAHYDTAGDWPGADDNAAAVAIALEVGARLRADPPARDVVVALFDAEEPPYFHSAAMGSTRFLHDQMAGPVHAAMILDLVGHELEEPGTSDLTFVTGMESDPDLERAIASLPEVAGTRLVTALNAYVGDLSDHHAFRLARIPYLFFTCGRWRHYHRSTDTPDRLAYGKMAALAEVVEALVRDVADRVLAGPWEGYDTTPTDARLMRATFGPYLERSGLRLETRDDVARLVGTLLERFAL